MMSNIFYRLNGIFLLFCLFLSCDKGLNDPSRDSDSVADLKSFSNFQDPLVATEEVLWHEAGNFIGKVVAVKGKIIDTHNSGKACFLNYASDWKGKFHLVLFSGMFPEFPAQPETFYLNRELLVVGKVSDYRGAPQIILENPDQVAFLDEGPTHMDFQKLDNSLSIPVDRDEGRSADASVDTVTIVSWNVENVFDIWDDPFSNDQVTRPAYASDARLSRIAYTLSYFDADVVCLQEIENRGLLQSFVDDYLSEFDYEVVLFEGNDTRGIDVALLSRIPLGPVTSYRHLRFDDEAGVEQNFQRDLLHVRVEGALAAEVFVVHLKSQHGGKAADLIREAEARSIAGILADYTERTSSSRVILAGDFNEVPEEKTLEILRDSGMIDLMSGTTDYSYNKEPYLSRIDYVMGNQNLLKDMISASIVQEIPGVDLEATSDHYPLRAIFKIP